MSTIAIGTSYFGSRILRHVAADMEDLAARGFTGVPHTYSENDLAYYRDQMTWAALVAALTDQTGGGARHGPAGGELEDR